MEMAKQNDRHRPGRARVTFWTDQKVKDAIQQDAADSGLHRWTVSDHMDYLARKHLRLWDKPYEPAQKAPGRRKSSVIEVKAEEERPSPSHERPARKRRHAA